MRLNLKVATFGALALALIVPLLAQAKDSDGDSLPDSWERRYGTRVHRKDDRRDPDHDGLRNRAEYDKRTNPLNPDTDGDSLSDGAEVKLYKTSPRRKDSDRDGIEDGDEDRDHDGVLNRDDDSSGSSSSASSSSDDSGSSSSASSGSSSSED